MLTKTLKAEDSEVELNMLYAEVYAPDRPDVDGEFMRAETIYKMAHDFVKAGRMTQIDTNHDNVILKGVQVVESFIARKGDPDFLEGAWVVGIHVTDPKVWESVKKGELNGLSMEAFVVYEDQEVDMEVPPVVSGKTSKSADHEHQYFVSFDEVGNFKGGVTDTIDGHFHAIKSGTVTESAKDHTHRFSSVDGMKILS